MRTEIVGQQADRNPEDFEPIIVPIAAYTLAGEEVVEEFAFRPVVPAGALLRAARSIQPNGVLATGPIVDFLSRSLLTEFDAGEVDDDGEPVVTNERDRFLDFLDREDLLIEAELISAVFRTVNEVWTERPTRRASASSSGGSRTKATSRGGARSRASASKTSRSS